MPCFAWRILNPRRDLRGGCIELLVRCVKDHEEATLSDAFCVELFAFAHVSCPRNARLSSLSRLSSPSRARRHLSEQYHQFNSTASVRLIFASAFRISKYPSIYHRAMNVSSPPLVSCIMLCRPYLSPGPSLSLSPYRSDSSCLVQAEI